MEAQQLLESKVKDLPHIGWDSQPPSWLAKTGGYAKDLSLRDYFAAKALASFIFAGCDYERAAKEAYAQADAMLEARNAA